VSSMPHETCHMPLLVVALSSLFLSSKNTENLEYFNKISHTGIRNLLDQDKYTTVRLQKQIQKIVLIYEV
jgi:hypothetical protein